MEIDIEDIDIERLRFDLMNFFGTAMTHFPVAVMDLSEVENASPEQLIQIAINNRFDITKYLKGKYR